MVDRPLCTYGTFNETLAKCVDDDFECKNGVYNTSLGKCIISSFKCSVGKYNSVLKKCTVEVSCPVSEYNSTIRKCVLTRIINKSATNNDSINNTLRLKKPGECLNAPGFSITCDKSYKSEFTPPVASSPLALPARNTG